MSIDFADAETRKQASVKKENGQIVLVPLFLGQESVVGEVSRAAFSPSRSLKPSHQEVEVAACSCLFTDQNFLTNSLILSMVSAFFCLSDVIFLCDINLFWLFQLR